MQLDLSHLTRPPFSLDAEALSWVAQTFSELTIEERVGQLFNLRSAGEAALPRDLVSQIAPGAITRFFGPDGDYERAHIADLQAASKVPLLVSADLEGSRMSLPFGTQVPNPIALAAIDDTEVTAEVSAVLAQEARAVGVNWSFTPVLDINATPRSAIVATRGSGSDPDRIERHMLTQLRSFQANGIAATAKHWPGEGHDDRDQHLVTTINPLSLEDWEATHGRLYRAAIDAGVMAVMSAHIAFPAWTEAQGLEGLDRYYPASLCRTLNMDLLRGRLGFNGLIVSDASEMAGLTAYIEAQPGKVELIRAGCDMILFSTDPLGDYNAVLAAVNAGYIDQNRLTDAVTRVLGLKAALGLHKRAALPEMPALRQDAMAPILRRAPVLEKDVANLLPISPKTHKRVLVVAPGIFEPLWNKTLPVAFPDLLAAEGFDVTLHETGTPADPAGFDLLIYAFTEETLLLRGRIFLDWGKLFGGLAGAMKRPWHSVPTVMVSFGYPYYLYDAPRVPTYINAWATMDEMQTAVVDLLLGRGNWNRNSPVDAFAGAPDARY
ncbi:glycoside hydrolase family 3 protein [Pseudoprimorskyibacter insulae]|uniref:beta-N-acetylhexosaminidase n=1 Tax=Pseudoprimorskyibacter insulae TaxID=1695997 RepID=A0A2R8AW64_9RHOB|nr:glycoside hydrolase family 3 N-terminal domain-containing protein [Pseudoprimorskyibacter insulae]SPF80263.1 Beta-N-acetylglucosaminidase/beta-glucosidase [Pseudoprimorskyibacter insulae]